MKEKKDLTAAILAAQKDLTIADNLIVEYMPFIKAETARFTGRSVTGDDSGEELSIAMFAFYEALCAWEDGKGAFLALARLTIRNRLIDFRRKEQRQVIPFPTLSLDEPGGEDEGLTAHELIPDQSTSQDLAALEEATRDEVSEFQEALSAFDLSLNQVADSCPKQERTLRACLAARDYAKDHPTLLSKMVKTRRLPLTELVQGAGVERKTLERHRDYLIAILLAYTNGFEIIRGHLKRLQPKEVQV